MCGTNSKNSRHTITDGTADDFVSKDSLVRMTETCTHVNGRRILGYTTLLSTGAEENPSSCAGDESTKNFV